MRVLVDVDLGMKRTGVATGAAAVTLARHVSVTPGLRFDGLMGYEGHTLMIADPTEKRAAITSAIADALGGHLFNRTPVSLDMILNHLNKRPQAHKPLQINTV